MSEMGFRQVEFTYSACTPLTKNKKRIKDEKWKETGYSRHIYLNE